MNSSFVNSVYRGLSSFLGMVLFPIGWWWCRSIDSFATPDRLNRGCVFVLSGIQGKSPIEFGMARGLNDGGVQCGIKIIEWTTGLWPCALFHLRSTIWHHRMANRIAQLIETYLKEYPNRPVTLIGHSGGAGLAMMAAKELSEHVQLSKIILLNPAVSEKFDIDEVLSRTEQGVWNFHSLLDFLFLGIGTCLAGTLDGKHRPAVGMIPFPESSQENLSCPQLHQIPYRVSLCRDWNFGGHFGYTNRLFLGRHIAPLIQSEQPSSIIADTNEKALQ